MIYAVGCPLRMQNEIKIVNNLDFIFAKLAFTCILPVKVLW